jgi:predicted phage terminase large subunit-like protein
MSVKDRRNALVDAAIAGYVGGGLLGDLQRCLEAVDKPLDSGALSQEDRQDIGSFREYVARVAPTFQFYRHVDLIADHLQDVVDGRRKRLMVFLPPRHTKSFLVSRLLPGYFLRRHPNRWVGLASYGANLAEGFSREARGYFLSDGGEVVKDARATARWVTAAGGGLWAAGVGGSATGKGYSLGIVDDPVKDAEEADSATYRRRTRDWWDTVFSTRAEPDAAQIIVLTRWHTGDLAGYLLDNEDADGWLLIDLPAIAVDPLEKLPIKPPCSRVDDWRSPGEALCPERYSLDALQATQRKMPPRWFSALYQQRPTSGEGSIFQRAWFRYFDPNAMDGVPIIRRLASIDCTYKDVEGSDYVALSIWDQVGEGLLLRHMLRERLAFNDTLTAIRSAWNVWQFSELLVEDAANGSAVLDTLKREAGTFGVLLRAVRPLGGKVARANAASPWYQQGLIFHPQGAPWLANYEDELLAFPAADDDDQVDSASQLIIFVSGEGPISISTVEWGRGVESDAYHVAGLSLDELSDRAAPESRAALSRGRRLPIT